MSRNVKGTSSTFINICRVPLRVNISHLHFEGNSLNIATLTHNGMS